MPDSSSFSIKRLMALCRKESYQIIRDPSSILICFVIPILLLFIFGYGINFDSSSLRVGIVLEDQGPDARRFADAFKASTYIDAVTGSSRQAMVTRMQTGHLRGIVVIPVDFSRLLHTPAQVAPIQVITDGSEPNTANFVRGYVTGVWQIWRQNRMQDAGIDGGALIDLDLRYWYNQAAISRNFIVPGAITIIITVVGAILTSLVIAREWERGTMEALLSTRVTRAELLLSKFIPYYVMGMLALLICMLLSTLLFRVPFRGSFFLLWLISSLFLANTLAMGLLISTLTRSQFNAAQVALNAAFLPAIMLSGFVFEIDSMPVLVRAATYIIPARYYVSVMHTLFLAGNVPMLLCINTLFLLVTAVLFLGLTVVKTRLRLE